ncbi:hemin uptake protein HemP [Pseudoxanthomonas taiwanensis]|jgi:Hemin uptake protein|uniref:Hemic uptake protein hemP n=1 Tax=Pseudoxanthomonas taiwanensis TaxID=176598 RepID=A0A921TGX8_9GAMM|nr:hemic uptake protein hemP [Pseudoxanthomonas taiwanensis]MBO2467065.1 hemin uptake protein HemP [Xanthomonadaceae bacterium]
MNAHSPTPPGPATRHTASAPAAAGQAALSSEQLLQGRREVLIRHGDRLYRLRHTSNDKLILTK